MADENIEPAAAAVLAENPEPEVEGGKWNKVVVVAGGRIPANVGRRRVIVAESRGSATTDEKTGVVTAGELKTSGYPKDADLYYRSDSSVEFPEGASIYTLSDNVRASGFGGFSSRGSVRLGNTHPAYAAANLAYHRGAKEIEIVGLKEDEKEAMRPWIESPKMPDGVKITLA